MQRTENMPLWVFLGFANVNTRKGALILIWSFFAISMACIPLAHFKVFGWLDWSWAAMLFPCTLWYWLCLRWVDKNAGWK